MATSDQSTLLHWQLLGNGSRVELLDEIATCHRPLAGPILAHYLCANDQRASGQLWSETSGEPKTHQSLW
jgi:hypothetical protein